MFVVLKVEGDSRGTPTMFLEIIEVKGGRSVCGRVSHDGRRGGEWKWTVLGSFWSRQLVRVSACAAGPVLRV